MQADWPQGTADLQQALVRVEQELRTSGQAAPTSPRAEDPAEPSDGVESLLEKAEDETPWFLKSSVKDDDGFNLSWQNTPDGGISFIKATPPRDGGLVNLLSKLEFNEAIALAKTINNKALSLSLQAAICRSAIESRPAKQA